MLEYLHLQFKILNRRIINFGLPLLIGYTLIPLVFIYLSVYLFEKTDLAIYVYGLIGISFISKLSESKRNDFLKSVYNKVVYKKIRVIENIICCLPFTLFLVYKNHFVFTVILNSLVTIITFLNFSTNINKPIPTPFSKNPFEFTIGFRKTFYIFPIAYFLTYISISVRNFNLGISSILLIGITCFSYYSKVEKKYFVWNYNLSSKKFLLEKTKICLVYFSFLSLPITITLSFYFFNEITTLIISMLLIYNYLSVIILAKYSAFPNDISLPQGILLILCFIFPPMLFIITPLFYSKSIKKLNTLLND